MGSSEEKKDWLINKDGEVLGPLAIQDLALGVVEGHYHPHMEVKKPGSCWNTMALFPEVVEALKASGWTLESTAGTLTEPTTPLTGTETFSPTVTDPLGEDDFNEVTVVGTSPPAAKPASAPALDKVYTWGEGQRAPRSQRAAGFVIWGLAAVVAFVGFLAWSEYQKTGASPLAAGPSTEEMIAEASKAWSRGRFAKALGIYRQVVAVDARSTEAHRRLVPLLLTVENQSVEAQRWINEMKMLLIRPEDLKEVFNLQGLADLYRGDWEAAERSFSQSLEQDSIYAPARWNRAMAYYRAKDYDSAATDFLSLQASYPEESTLMYWQSLAARENHSGPELLPKVEGGFAYQQEAALLLARAALARNDDAALGNALSELLTTDADLSALHFKDPGLYMKPLHWQELSEVCHQVGQSAPFKWQGEAVVGLCYLKTGDLARAKTYFENSLARTENPLVKALLAKVYWEQGESSKVQILLPAMEPSPLSELLSLRVAHKAGDYKAMEATLEGLQHPQYSLQKEYYLATVSHQRGNLEKAKYHFRRAQSLSPRFLPLKELEEKIYP